MKTFTSINEENINLGKFEITEDQFRHYKNFIINILNQQLYSSHLEEIKGLGFFVKALKDDATEGRDFTIFNKCNTNITLLRWIVNLSKCETFDELRGFIYNNKRALFIEGGQYFDQVRKILVSTETQGNLNEKFAADYIKFIVKKNLNIDITPTTSVPMSKDDMIYGIDIKFTINNKEYTCQVKPLVNYHEKDETFIIQSSGRIKPYKTDYLAFVDISDKKTILVRNSAEFQKKITILNDKILVPVEAIVDYL